LGCRADLDVFVADLLEQLGAMRQPLLERRELGERLRGIRELWHRWHRRHR
jgi:hypothetical protein